MRVYDIPYVAACGHKDTVPCAENENSAELLKLMQTLPCTCCSTSAGRKISAQRPNSKEHTVSKLVQLIDDANQQHLLLTDVERTVTLAKHADENYRHTIEQFTIALAGMEPKHAHLALEAFDQNTYWRVVEHLPLYKGEASIILQRNLRSTFESCDNAILNLARTTSPLQVGCNDQS